MGALAVDMQLDFWTSPEPEPDSARPWAPGVEAVSVARPVEPEGGERTLEELILGCWEALAAGSGVDCPVCGGELAAQYGAHARPVRASCRGCGTELS